MASVFTLFIRVVATTTTGFVNPNVESCVKWQGTSIDELSRAFPPSEIFGADPLEQKEIEDGFIVTRYTFERQQPNGEWKEIDDPRRRISPVTKLERAIDEENRRLYPGDYFTGCDACGYESCQCDDYEGSDY